MITQELLHRARISHRTQILATFNNSEREERDANIVCKYCMQILYGIYAWNKCPTDSPSTIEDSYLQSTNQSILSNHNIERLSTRDRGLFSFSFEAQMAILFGILSGKRYGYGTRSFAFRALISADMPFSFL